MRRLLLCAALLACGCKARTEIVLGVITDLLAPDLLDTVKLKVTNSDSNKILVERDWNIPGTPNTEFILPGSFGLYSDDGSEPRVEIEVTGYKGGSDSTPRVTHRSVLNLISEQTLFLRESLVAGCRDNTDCKLDQNQTCLEGRCVDSRIDPKTLPRFSAQLINTIECDSGTQFINTATRTVLVPTGACTGGQFCREGTCYNPPVVATSPTWHSVPTPTTFDLNAVSGVGSPATLFAVGAHGTILRLSPGAATAASGWVEEPSPVTSDLYSVWGADLGQVFAVGAGGVILTRDPNGMWTQATSPTTADLRAVWGSSPLDVWAVGGAPGAAVVLHGSDGAWALDARLPGGLGELRGVSGSGPFDVWVAGRSGALAHFTSPGWVTGPASTETFTSVFAQGGLTYFAASSGRLFTTSDGTALAPVDLGGNSNALTNVYGFGGDVFAVGSGGAIYHRASGGAFAAEYADTPAHLAGVWGDSLANVYAVGAQGEVVHAIEGAAPDGGASQPDLLASPDLLACGPVSLTAVGGPVNTDGGVGFSKPTTLAYDGAQFLYVLNSGGQLVQLDLVNGTSSYLAIFGSAIDTVSDLVADTQGNLYACDGSRNVILSLTPVTGGLQANFLAGGQTGFIDGVNDVAGFNGPSAIALDTKGVLYVADVNNFAVRTVQITDGTTATLAGTGAMGSADGAGGRSGVAQFGLLRGIAVDPVTADVYVLDGDAASLRRIAPDGTTQTFLTGFLGTGLSADGQGHLYAYNGGLTQVAIAGGAQLTLIAGGSSFTDGAGCSATVTQFLDSSASPGGQQVFLLDTASDLVHKATFP